MGKNTLVIKILFVFAPCMAFIALFAISGDLEDDIDTKALIRLEKKEVQIGDPISVTIEVEGPAGTKFHWPDIKALLPEFSVTHVNYDASHAASEKACERCTFDVTIYKVGTFDIPSIPIHYERAGSRSLVQTSQEHIVVQSILKHEDEKLADIKGPIKIPFDVWPVILGTLVVLIAAAAGIFLLFWIKRRGKKQKVIPAEDIFKGIPPHEWAYSELDKLLERKLLEKGLHKDFYIAFSEILKRYLEGRYRMDAMEKTTDEIRENIAKAKINSQYCREALSIFEECDLVKFAKYIPEHEHNKMSIQQFYSFIDATKPQEEEMTAGKEIREK